MAKHISIKQSKLLKRHEYMLQKLAKSSSKDRQVILRNAPPELFKALDLIYKLVANKQIYLPAHKQAKLKKHHTLIKKTSRLGSTLLKKKLPRQTGGSLKSILSTVLPVIGTIVRALI